MNCKSCGGTLKAGAKFCSGCGAVVPPVVTAPSTPPPEQFKLCPQCGAQNPVATKFCRIDGYNFFPPAVRAASETDTQQPLPTLIATEEPKSTDLVCPSCGTVNPPNARFCRKDGVALAGSVPVHRHSPPVRSVVEATPQDRPKAAAMVDAAAARMPPRGDLSPPKPQASRPAAPVVPSNAAPPIPPRERKSVSKSLLAAIAAGLVLFVVGLLGYLYWTGVVGDRPGSVAREITAELKQKGFLEVAVAVDKNWTASVSGSVVGQDKLEAVKGLLAARSEIRGSTFDSLEVRPSTKEILADVETALASKGLATFSVLVGDEGVVQLTGAAESPTELVQAIELIQAVPGVKEVQNQTRRGAAWLERDLNSNIRDAGFADVRARVHGLDNVVLSGSLPSEDARAKVIDTVFRSGQERNEPIAPSAVHDEMTVAAPVVVAAPVPARKNASPAAASTFESAPEPPPPVAQGSAPVRGLWVGSVTQKILGFQVNLRLEAVDLGQPAGKTVYSTDGKTAACQGSLLLVEATPEQYTFEETIERRGLLCPGGGTLRMSLTDAKTANVKWSRTATPDKVAAKGEVRRR